MVDVSAGRWRSLEQWSPNLFLLGGVFLLIAAANRGIAFLLESYAFNDWVGLAVVLGRGAVLLGILGLSVRITESNPRSGKWTLRVATLAIVFATGLLVLAILDNTGFTTEIIAVFGLGTFLLSLIAFIVAGVSIVRTGAYSKLIGYLLLVSAVALLVVFFGQMLVTEEIIGTVIEATLFLLYLGIGYLLRTQSSPATRTATTDSAT